MKKKNTKTEFRYFTIVQWKKEQEYLQERHRSGWKFTHVNGLGIYHFESCDPEEVVYQLDYNPDGTAHKEEYVQMFRDCGWEYLQDYVGYSYFRKPVSQMQGAEEIFCDDASRLDMLKRVFRGRMIPLIFIFFFIIVPQLVLRSIMDDPVSRFLGGMFFVLAVLYLILFLLFGYQFWKVMKES